MIVEPKIRGFICTTAHPAGCARNVEEQVEYVKSRARFSGPKRVLVIGSSTGYGLATRIAAAFGGGADTIGVAFERPASKTRTATAGWYNTAAFQELARRDGLAAKSIMGDAFSPEIKRKTAELIKNGFGQADLVVYSLAAPRRTLGETTYSSVLKPVGTAYSSKSIDMSTRRLTEVTIPPATEEEIEGTVRVMGGEDWKLWIDALREADALAPGVTTLAYSYIGPSLTHAIYKDGTIGMAKKDVERTAKALTKELAPLGGRAFVSVNKAVVTQASAAIPVVPLYISILFKIMKENGLHEGCVEQMRRLLAEKLCGEDAPVLDAEGRLRLDDLELRADVQAAVARVWDDIRDDTLPRAADLEGYWSDFYRLFGFGLSGVDYAADVETEVEIPGLV